MSFADRWATLTRRQKQVVVERCRCKNRNEASRRIGIAPNTFNVTMMRAKEHLEFERVETMCFHLGVLVGTRQVEIDEQRLGDGIAHRDARSADGVSRVPDPRAAHRVAGAHANRDHQSYRFTAADE